MMNKDRPRRNFELSVAALLRVAYDIHVTVLYRMFLTRPLILTLVLLCAIAHTTGQTQNFHAYRTLGQKELSALMQSQTRTVINLGGNWQHVEDGVPTKAVYLPSGGGLQERIHLRRVVRLEASTLAERSWQLMFLGVSDEVELRVNNRNIMRYPGGMVPFIARIPDRALMPGNNTIELVLTVAGDRTVRVEQFARNARRRQMGVLREVLLVGTPHVWTSDLRTTVNLATGHRSAAVTVQSIVNGGMVERIAGDSANELVRGRVNVTVEATLASPDGTIVARASPQNVQIEQSRQVETTMKLDIANPRLWSPASPELYKLTMSVSIGGRLIDVQTSNVGVRSVRIGSTERGRRFMLNDSAIFVNAVEYVDDYPGLGATLSSQLMERDVSLLKTLGVNAVRFSNGSPHPYMLHLCDRYGLMVLCELPAFDIPKSVLLEEESTARLRNASERLLAYAGTHPSIVAIGLGSGLEEGAETVASYFRQFSASMRLNGARLLYKVIPAALVSRASEGGFDIVIVHFASPKDRGAFSNTVRECARVMSRACVLTSFGALLSPENRNGISDPLSNEAQAVVIRDAYRATATAGLGGCVVWTFNDYVLERPSMLTDGSDPYERTSGLVDEWRQQRVSFAMYKSLINDEKEPLLQARDHTDQTPLVFIVTGIVLGLLLVLLINRSRRFREYLTRAIVRPYNFYADIRDQRILSSIQTSILGVVIASSVGLIIASLLHFMRTDGEIEYLLHLLLPSPQLYEGLRFIVWRPALAVLVCSGFVLLTFLVFALLLRIGAMFVRGRILVRDTFTIVVWSALPLVILLPLAIAFYQVLSADAMSVWVPLIIGIITIWFIVRMLRATSVVFDVSSTVVYLVGLGFVVLALGSITWFYVARYDAAAFVQYYLAVVSAG